MITSEVIKEIIAEKVNNVAGVTRVSGQTLSDIFDFRYYVFYDQYDENDAGKRTPVLVNPSQRDTSFALGYKSITVNGTININVNVNKIALLEWLIFKVEETLNGIFFDEELDGDNCRYSLAFDNLVYSEVFKSSQGNSISITVPFSASFFLTDSELAVYTYQDYAFDVSFDGLHFVPLLAQSISFSTTSNQEAIPLVNYEALGSIEIIRNRSVKLTALDFVNPFLALMRDRIMGLDNRMNEPLFFRVTMPEGDAVVMRMNCSGIVYSTNNNGVGSFDITLTPAAVEE